MSQPPGLIKKINEAQTNKQYFLKIIQDFLPLNQKYAYKLGYDDALSDMQLDFIHLIRNFNTDHFYPKKDQYVLGYIKKAVYNSYIKHAKNDYNYRNHYYPISSLTTDDEYLLNRLCFTYDHYEEINWRKLKSILTEQQYKIILFLYYLDKSVSETGHALGISRQSVNQTKNKALKKLREAWSE